MPSLADVATRIVESAAPVLLLDTCAILDVVRAPMVKNGDTIARTAGSLLRAAAKTPPRVALVACELTADEFSQNRERVSNDFGSHTQKLRRDLLNVDAVWREVDPTGGSERPWPVDFEGALLSLGNQLMGACYLVDSDDSCRIAAGKRVVESRPPASRRGAEYHDCEIFEHYLALARSLRSNGLQKPICFVSSNTRDYGAPGNLDPRFAQELVEAQVDYVTNLAWAAHVAGVENFGATVEPVLPDD